MASSLLEELRAALREQYAVESEVGRGGMATVFLAEDLKHGRQVAIKVLSPELSSSMDGDRFKREIQIAARLSHPHILPVFDSGEANGLLYYVMPFVEGESLRGRLKRETQLSIDDAIAITCEVADALSYAHSFGVIHRDIKPENILLNGGHAVVADFGIARVIQDAGGEKLTKTGMSVGTAAYMSPEQFSGENVDGRSDLYSLACVLYEMLVGEVPFTGPNAVAIMARHTMELPPSIQIVRQTVPDELEGAIMHALEKVPADRFATVSQFKEALLGQGATSTYTRRTRATIAAAGRRSVAPRRRRTLAVGGIIMLVLFGGVLAGRYYMGRSGTNITQAGNLASDASANRIAVLYFENDTRDSSLNHIATGLTESLIGQLNQVEGLDVISAGGVAPYQHAGISTDSIARALKTGTLVRGSIDKDGGKLRVSAQLVDASGATFQRASFLVPERAYLNARDSLAGVVSRLLRERLGEEVRLREQRSGTSSPEAWAHVQRVENLRKEAEALYAGGKSAEAVETLVKADSVSATAGALDVKWPQPEIERAWIAYRRARFTKDHKIDAILLDSASDHAERALALDARSPEALEIRGLLRSYRAQRGFIADQKLIDQTLHGAEADLQTAVEISPRQATAWYSLSGVYFAQKRVLEASNAARRAYEADAYLRAAPDIVYTLWQMSYNLAQFEEAINWCSLGTKRFPSDSRFVFCKLFLMLSKAVPADPQGAWRLVDDLQRVTPPQEWDYNRRQAQLIVAGVLGRAGLVDSAHRVIERSRVEPAADPRGDLIGLEAVTYTLLGEHDRAITLLEQFLTNHPEHRAGFAKLDTWWWRDLQNNPRFKALVATAR